MISSDELERYMQQRAEQDYFSGVVLITQGSSQLFAGAYGYASRSWKVPNTLTTRFDTASVTKLFTAVATLQLIDRGALAFDTPVIHFLGLQDTTISHDVNVFHLLTHTSGIADDAEEESGEGMYADIWKTRSNYAVIETADFLPQFAYKPPNFAPGQGCRYCNCSFVLLGLLIEKVSGLSYRDYVRQHIFAPAGMLHSDFFRMDEVNEDVAEGCDPLRDEHGEYCRLEEKYLFLPTHRIARWRGTLYRQRSGPLYPQGESWRLALSPIHGSLLHSPDTRTWGRSLG